MREPFEYEANARIIRQVLVPAHMGETDWQAILTQWQHAGAGRTLLEHLAFEWKNEAILLEILSESLHASICRDPVYLARHQLDATTDMLRNHGFAPLGNISDKRLIAGGREWNPDLRKYLGTRASDWKWVLVSPVRKHANPAHLDSGKIVLKKESEIAGWLRQLISGLWSAGVSDIHFETVEDSLVVRTHEATRMRTIGEWPDGRSSPVIRLLCRWAGITDWDQTSFVDGTLNPDGNSSTRLRFSLIPTVNGSSIVLRAPAPSLHARNLNHLGLPEALKNRLMDKILYGSGLILCTGSTGSGKTTTLYGILNELRHENLKILTIEDPVEQEIPHAVQSSLDSTSGWTFDKAVHAFLRQDPDIIMVGEIRDAVSAAAACRAALTGHSVLSTMHAANPESAMVRLSQCGIPDGILRETDPFVIHQRMHYDHTNRQPCVKFTWQAQNMSGDQVDLYHL